MSDVETDEDLTAPLLDDAFYRGDPFPHYARLRAEAPVAWNRQHGFWVLSRHADVMAASADPATFCSSKGILVQEIGVDYASPPTIMHTDPPDHTRYRKLVQPGFGPRQTRELDGAVRERAQLLIDALPAGDAVEVVSSADGHPPAPGDHRPARRGRRRLRPLPALVRRRRPRHRRA